MNNLAILLVFVWNMLLFGSFGYVYVTKDVYVLKKGQHTCKVVSHGRR